MATATKEKKSKSEKKPYSGPKVNTGKTEKVKLTAIVSNVGQSRGMGVLTEAATKGWGLFKSLPDHEDKKPLWSLLTSDDPEDNALGVQVMEENEAELIKLADSIRSTGQLQDIGVRPLEDEDELDVVFGMGRALAVAYNYAKDTKNAPDTINAKVLDADLSVVDLKILALKENEDRRDESPIDRAMTYKFLTKEGGLTPDDVGRQLGYSAQHIRDYIKLLDKDLEDKRAAIHAGKLKVDPALKLLAKRKAGETDAEVRGGSGDKNASRPRLPSVKKITRLLEAKRKPKNVKEDEWSMWIDPTIRKFMCYYLNLDEEKYGEYVEPPPEPEKPAKAAKAGKNGKKGKKEKEAEEEEPSSVFKVKKERAAKLLIGLGQANARTYSDSVLKEKLEDIPNQGDPDEIESDGGLKKLYDKLMECYQDGTKIKVVSKE